MVLHFFLFIVSNKIDFVVLKSPQNIIKVNKKKRIIKNYLVEMETKKHLFS